MPKRWSALRPGPVPIRRALLPTLFLAGFVAGGPVARAPDAPAARACGADLMHPLQVHVVPQGPVRPGAALSATVTVTSRRALDGVTLRVEAPSDVALLSAPSRGLGAFQAGEERSDVVTLIAPRGGPRRTVHILVTGTADGVPVSRGAVLNLALDEEPAREVAAPDGRTIREVRARKVR